MASNTREIVSFQIGHYANYVGTHWWNIQDSSFVYNPSESRYPSELNHDVLFREGMNMHGDVTFTPRLIALDLKGSLNTLKQEGVLYDIEGIEDDLNWVGDVTLHKSDAGPKNEFLKHLEKGLNSPQERDAHETDTTEKEMDKDEDDKAESDSDAVISAEQQVFGPMFYDLDDNVNVWSDYLKVHLHPKSVGIVEQYRHGWETQPFDVFCYGQEVYKHHETKLQIEDRMHFFLEDCDNIQGMQFTVDTHDGFGGLASSMVEELSDDYSNKSMVIYSVSPPSFPDDSIVKQCHRAVNSLLSYDQLINYSSMIVPISLASSLWRKPGVPREWDYVKYNSELPYHTSALLAASLDTASIPYRLDAGGVLMSHFTDSMTTLGRKMLSLQTAIPLPLANGGYFADYLFDLGDTSPWQCITPACVHDAKPSHQSVVVRGIPKTRYKRPPVDRKKTQFSTTLDRCENIEQLLQLYLEDVFSSKLNSINSILQPLLTTTPYPHIINRSYLWGGAGGKSIRPPPLDSSSVNVMNVGNVLQSSAALSSSSNLQEGKSFTTNVGSSGSSVGTVNKTSDSINMQQPRILTNNEASEVPMMTALQCSADVRNHLTGLIDVCKKFNIAKFHRFVENGLEADIYKESIENLVTMAECYGGETSDSDSDDD